MSSHSHDTHSNVGEQIEKVEAKGTGASSDIKNVTAMLQKNMLRLLLGFIVLIFIFSTIPAIREAEVKSKTAQDVSSSPLQTSSAIQQNEVRWDKTSDNGILPTNVWSEYVSLGVGCSVKFVFDPSIHRVKYRFYSAEEKEYEKGTSPNMSEFSYMILKEGITKVPYTLQC